MTTPIDEAPAEVRAREALVTWGMDRRADLLATRCAGGWRFRVRRTNGGGRATGAGVGGSDAVVRATDGAVLRVPAGATDAAVARLLQS